MFLDCPFLSAVMAGLYFSSSPLRAKKGMGNKGTAVDTLWPAWGVEGEEGSGGKKQIVSVCQQMQLGKENTLKSSAT